MEAKGARRPTELAQFLGIRLALCGETNSSMTWADSRVLWQQLGTAPPSSVQILATAP